MSPHDVTAPRPASLLAQFTNPVFLLPRWSLALYGLVSVALSMVLLAQSLRRGVDELALWSVAYAVVGFVSVRRPQDGPLVAGIAALLLGWVRTYERGINLDLGLSLIALSVGISVLDRVRRRLPLPLGLPGMALVAIGLWSLVSLAFSVARIRDFALAPGFGYRLYPFNPLGLSSEEAIIRTTVGATTMFVWFGLYEWARHRPIRRESLHAVVFLVLLVNAAALLWQRYADPTCLLPHGFPITGRLNGVTSFCYALGDVVVALFLLLPLWASGRGVRGALTAGSLLMLLHAAIASGSRTTLAVMFVSAFLWMILRVVHFSGAGHRLRAYASAGAATLLVLGAVAAYVATPPDMSTPVGRFKEQVALRGLYGSVFDTRLQGYALNLRVMEEYPLSGVGAGLYLAEVGKQRQLLIPDLELAEPYLLESYAPNQFINVGVELGVLPMLALVLTLAHVLVSASRFAWANRSHAGSGDLVVSLLALGAALQLGPSFYNSEALVFFFLLLASTTWDETGSAQEDTNRSRRGFGGRGTVAVLAGVVAVGTCGGLISASSLAVENQWKKLRWHLAAGMRPPEGGGRWTRPRATFSVDTRAPEVIVRWHAGDETVRDYTADVSFYVDGVLVERSPAVSGHIRESALPLPDVEGYKRISVNVWPPFIPAATAGSDDRRHLGVFIHSVRPSGTEGSVGSPLEEQPEP